MKNERIRGLALMYAHKDIEPNVSVNKICPANNYVVASIFFIRAADVVQ